MYSNFTMMPGKGSLVKEHEHVLGGGGVRRGGGGGVLTSTIVRNRTAIIMS